VDPLFRSAAEAYGNRVACVVLTGGGDDGANGLLAIKRAHGISIAQDPKEAKIPMMPSNAIIYDHIDLILPLNRIATVLQALASGESIPGRSG
jgi:two-component system chemotaxis response regulator CheB